MSGDARVTVAQRRNAFYGNGANARRLDPPSPERHFDPQADDDPAHLLRAAAGGCALESHNRGFTQHLATLNQHEMTWTVDHDDSIA